MNKNYIRRVSESILFEERKEDNLNEINFSKLKFVNVRKQRSLYGKMGLEEIILVSKDIKGVNWYYFNELDDIYGEINQQLISLIGANFKTKGWNENWHCMEQADQLLFIHETVYAEFIKEYERLQADDEFFFQYWRGIVQILLKKPYIKTVQLGKFKTKITIQEEGDIDIEEMSLEDLEEFLEELEDWQDELEENEPEEDEKQDEWEDLWNHVERMIEEVEERIEELEDEEDDDEAVENLIDDSVELDEEKDFECHFIINDEAIDEIVDEVIPSIKQQLNVLSDILKRFKK